MPAEKERMGPDRLMYKEDWPEARERYRALWAGEIIDRACISVTAPREDRRAVPSAATWEEYYTDIDYVLAKTNAQLPNTYYGGEAIPTGSSFLGYVGFGGEPVFVEETIWIKPTIRNWDTPYRFDPDNRWCRRFIEIYWALIEDGHVAGKYLVDTGGCHNPLDIIMKMRGSEELCYDLLEHPDEIHAAQEELIRAWKWVFTTRFDRIPEDHGWGCLGIWAPGRLTMTCCDFSAMISPKHFEEFVIRDIEGMASCVDYSFYHLDGPTALQHLPALLDCEAVHGIQWVRGAGDQSSVSALEWVGLCKKVQSAGKVVQMHCGYDEVEPLLQELDPRRLQIVTGAPSVEAADALLRSAERWSCKGVY